MRKRRLIISVTVLLSGMLLTGCGSNTPEDVAKIFASSLSSANIKEAKEVSTENTQKKIDRLIKLCNEPYYHKLIDEVAKVYNTMNSKKNSEFNIGKRMNDPDIKKDMKEMMKSLTEKYGDVKKLPHKKQMVPSHNQWVNFHLNFLKPTIYQ